MHMPQAQLQKSNVEFNEVDAGLRHFCNIGAPCTWSEYQGATHTLHTMDGYRPAQVFKTFALIGVDEDEFGKVIWERWNIRNVTRMITLV